MSDSEYGIIPESFILSDMAWRLDAEVAWQNQLLSLSPAIVEHYAMREVKQMSSNLRGMIDGIRKATSDAQNQFNVEGQRAIENAHKVQAVAAELKDANLEVESFLGETGSNFAPLDSSTPPAPSRADINGVTLNERNKG